MPAHQLEPEPPERTPTTAAPEPVISAAPAQRVLALQRQIGNRAVGALLARAPTKAPPKMPTPKPPELKDGIYGIVPGVGTIEVHSAQLGTHRQMTNPTGRSIEREPATPAMTEIVVTSDLGDHSDKLFRWSLSGKPATVEIRFVKGGKAYLTIKLHQALITSYSVSGHGGDVQDRPLESWALHGTKLEYEAAQAPPAESAP